MDINIKYGCLMAYADIPRWNDVTKLLDNRYVEDDGLEMNPHVNVLSGIDIGDKSKVNEIHKLLNILKIEKFPMYITGIGIFQHDGFDILKFDIESNILRRLNYLFDSIFINTDMPTDYTPHMTIARTIPDTANQYVTKFDKPIKIYPNKFVYSEDDESFDNLSYRIR